MSSPPPVQNSPLRDVRTEADVEADADAESQASETKTKAASTSTENDSAQTASNDIIAPASEKLPEAHARPQGQALVTPQSPVAASISTAHAGPATMVFSELYKSPRSPLAKLRHQPPPQPDIATVMPTAAPDWLDKEHADLLSRDKGRQKEALKRYLGAKIRSDWDFQWPPHNAVASSRKGDNSKGDEGQTVPETAHETQTAESPPHNQVQDEMVEEDGYHVEDDSCDDDAQSVYSVESEDNNHFRPRIEWTSDMSEDESLSASIHPFRFDSPDRVGADAQTSVLAKRDRRRRELRGEMATNEGLACFEARRAAWTGARTVRIRAKPVTPVIASPKSPRRFFFRRSMSGSPPRPVSGIQALSGDGSGGLTSDTSSLARDNDRELSKQPTKDTAASTPPSPANYPVETIVPVAQPLLPPNNPLRASITPAVYLNLYDKVIMHNLQPSCPINLSDMLRSCVAGWKRDGEWPPRPASAMDPSLAARRRKKAAANASQSSNRTRRLSFGLLGREKEEESRTGKGIKRSLQRALGLGIDHHGGEKPKEV